MTEQEFTGRLEPNKIRRDLATQLKGEELPLIIWGSGDVAEAVCGYLKEKGIVFDGVWSDGMDQGMKFHGHTIKSREEIKREFPRFNVLLGHAGYDQGKELPKQMPQVSKVFYAFSIHYEQYEAVPYKCIVKEANRFVWLCNRVADEKSVDNLLAYLNTKMTRNVAHIINTHDKRMNFYRNDVYELSDQEVLLDIGAYTGDTIQLFLRETDNKYKKIIALEPDNKSFLELNEYIASKRLKNVTTSKLGAWDKEKDLVFKSGNEQISSVETGKHILADSDMAIIHASRLDEFFKAEGISIIKINYYEGVLEAIKGCEGILAANRPKLAIDVGFDIYNVLKLAEYIDSLDLGYQLYLRFNMPMSSTFTLYAKI